MRFALAVAVCGGLLLVGCGGGSSGGGNTTPPILPPTASAGGPYTGQVGAAVNFNGGGSKDPQNQALTYSWSFGDGSTGTGSSPTHTYSPATQNGNPTVYTVSLTVQNTSGFTGQTSTTATIAGAPPLSDATLTGSVVTGSTAITGAHVYLMAAGAAGYGAASASLLRAAQTGYSDTAGNAYVVTDPTGHFTMTGDYTCTSTQQLYLYVLGGTAGSQPVPSAGLMAVIGSCPATGGSAVSAQVNEVSTIAAAYAMAGFAVDALHVSSSATALSQAGLANAFASAANLVKLSTGAAPTTTPAGNGTVPQTQINALANILSVCVNPGTVATPYSSANCSSLLADAQFGGAVVGDTATAAINIAHNPGAGLISDLYNLPNAAPYTPTVGRQPNDFTIAVSYSGSGLNGPQGVAVDGSGNVWVTNSGGNSVTKLTSTGAAATGSPFSSGGLSTPYGIAIDGSGNAWIANNGSGSVTELSSSGTVVSTGSGYTGCNLSGPKGVAIDGLGNVWLPDYGHNLVCEMSSSGSAVSPGDTGGGLNNPDAVVIDGSGNAWVANYSGSSVSKFSSSGATLAGANGYTGGGLAKSDAVAIDVNGSAWVADQSPASLTLITKAGVIVAVTNASLSSPAGVAIDGLGNVWVANQAGNTVTELTNGGTGLSGSAGFGGAAGAASGIAIDGSGNVWVGNNTQGSLTEYVGAAAPVMTPLSVAVKNNALGVRP